MLMDICCNVAMFQLDIANFDLMLQCCGGIFFTSSTVAHHPNASARIRHLGASNSVKKKKKEKRERKKKKKEEGKRMEEIEKIKEKEKVRREEMVVRMVE